MKKLVLLVLLFIFSSVIGQTTNVKKNNKDSLEISVLIKKSVALRRQFKLDSSLYFSSKAIFLAKKNNYTALLGSALMREGITYYTKTDYTTAFTRYNNALLYFNKAKDTSGIASTYANLGSLHSQQNQLEKAMNYFFKAIDLYKKLNSPKREIISLFNISLISFRQKLYDQSADYCFQIQEIIKKNKLGTYLNTNIENQLGNIYYTKGDLEKAAIHYQLTLQFSKAKKDIRRQVLSLVNLGAIYIDTNQFNKAEISYTEALQIINSIEASLAEKAVVYIGLADVNYRKKQYAKGVVFAKKGLALATTQKQTEFERDAHKILSNIYAAKNNYKTAFSHLSQFKQLADSLSNSTSVSLVKEIETKYQTQQKENKILTLENETQQKEIALQKSRLNTNLSLSGLVLALLLGGFLLHRRRKQQQLNLLKTAIKSTENEKRRIGKELHDGIASNLMRLAHNTEQKDVKLSHQLLDSYNEIRHLSHQLNNTSIKGELLIDRLFDVLPEDTENHLFNLKISPITLSVAEPYGTHLYRICQELIANNIKHANATRTTILIDLLENNIQLKYADNGIGNGDFNNGIGLKNIADRVTLMNGTLSIFSEENKGFTVTINIPYTE